MKVKRQSCKGKYNYSNELRNTHVYTHIHTKDLKYVKNVNEGE